MSLLKAGEGAANYGKFSVTCVVNILRFSVTAICPNMGARKKRKLAILLSNTQRRLHTEQGISQAGKKFTPLLPQLSMAMPTVTSSSVADCLAAIIGPCALPFVGLSSLVFSTGMTTGFNVHLAGVCGCLDWFSHSLYLSLLPRRSL